MILKKEQVLPSGMTTKELESRHMMNLAILKEKGLQVIDVDKQDFVPGLVSQNVNEYLCKRGDWQFIVKDKVFLEDIEGVLSLEDIKHIPTSKTKEIYIDLKGKNTPIKRLEHLFKALDQTEGSYIDSLYHVLLDLQGSSFIKKDTLKKETYRLTGRLELNWKGKHMFLTPIENEDGELFICLSNNVNWRSPLQNGNATTGVLLPMELTSREDLMKALSEFEILLDQPEPIASIYEEAYRQAYCD